MYAIGTLRDAFAVTKRYFGALGSVGWLKLALVVLFLGGITITTQFFNVPLDAIAEGVDDPDVRWLAVAVLLLVLSVYGAFRYLAALLEFVFVESLRSEAIHLRRYGRANLGRALWLLAFRILLWLGLIIAIAALVGAVIVGGDVTDVADLSDGLIALIVLSAIVIFVGWYAVYTLTTAFVVPIMLQQACGPIAAWRRFVPTLASNWSGMLGYLVIAWLIGFAFWMLFAMIGFFLTFFGIIAFVLVALLFEAIHPNLLWVAVVLLLLAYLGYQYVVAAIEAPVRSFVRYHALLILGDTDDALDLIPAQRAAVRSDDGTGTAVDRSAGRDPREAIDWEQGTDADRVGRGGESASSDRRDVTRDEPTWNRSAAWDDLDGWTDESERDGSTGSDTDSSDGGSRPWSGWDTETDGDDADTSETEVDDSERSDGAGDSTDEADREGSDDRSDRF
ncbi:DUF7544 domain-containing protein [Natronorubrum texcoconense]|uniref:Uncharacterized protein n=1 Tax=Natronorubrum texcoconense TaxID=1095776 RepID=A0A1G8XXW8_9EURY|nr:hypothetical protein [Natronorubrum texcoconense]SDJ95356.1 hypothetical protein SAMN04515672_1944 [Natronorubrum texcoconense]